MTETSVPRERLLEVAERLFSKHGYAAIKLRDVAQAAGLHHSSLYHHAPGGKAQLFADAMQRGLDRHARELRARLDADDGDLRAQLRAAAGWVLANPAGNHARMLTTDLPNLPPEVGERIAVQAWRGLVGALAGVLRDARDRGEIVLDDGDTWLVGGALLAALQALQTADARFAGPRPAAHQADRLLDVFLDGLRPR